MAPDLYSSSSEFQWAPTDFADDTKSVVVLKERLCPNPPVSPPEGVHYPVAQEYILERCTTHRRGYIYTSSFDTSQKSKYKQQILAIRNPPGIQSFEKDGALIIEPIAGMIQQPAGVPFVQYIDGDRNKPVTIGVLHTLESLSMYKEGEDVRRWSEELRELVWGRKETESQSEIRPFYAARLKQNLRSSTSSTSSTSIEYSGSFSLAVTKGEGEGNGVGIPSLQYASPAEQQQIASILRLLHLICRAVLSCSLSKFELSIIDFNHEDNNIFGFGGLDPNNTGCQANVSSGGGKLSEKIGKDQGQWHADRNDCPYRWTVFTLFLRLPPGMSICYNISCNPETNCFHYRSRSRTMDERQTWLIYP